MLYHICYVCAEMAAIIFVFIIFVFAATFYSIYIVLTAYFTTYLYTGFYFYTGDLFTYGFERKYKIWEYSFKKIVAGPYYCPS